MKRKIISVLLTLVLVLSFSLVTAVPVAALSLEVTSISVGTWTHIDTDEDERDIEALKGENVLFWNDGTQLRRVTYTWDGSTVTLDTPTSPTGLTYNNDASELHNVYMTPNVLNNGEGNLEAYFLPRSPTSNGVFHATSTDNGASWTLDAVLAGFAGGVSLNGSILLPETDVGPVILSSHLTGGVQVSGVNGVIESGGERRLYGENSGGDVMLWTSAASSNGPFTRTAVLIDNHTDGTSVIETIAPSGDAIELGTGEVVYFYVDGNFWKADDNEANEGAVGVLVLDAAGGGFTYQQHDFVRVDDAGLAAAGLTALEEATVNNIEFSGNQMSFLLFLIGATDAPGTWGDYAGSPDPRNSTDHDIFYAPVTITFNQIVAPPATTVYVDAAWASQTNVNAFDPSLIWQYDAFASIQNGIDAVAEGGTVNVAAGMYVGNLEITVPNLTLKSVVKHGAVIQTELGFDAGSGYGGITVLADGVTIDGFEIVQDVDQSIIHTHDSDNVTIKNNRIVGSDGARPRGIDVGYTAADSDNVRVEGNEFEALYCGLYIHRGLNLMVDGNEFVDMGDGAIVFDNVSPYPENVEVKNNNATDANYLLYFFVVGGSVTAEGNTLVNTELSNYGVYNTEQNIYFPTIQSAINVANTGDTITVAAGTYEEAVLVDVEGMTVRGESLDAVVDGGFLLKADNITIDGLTIKNGGFGTKPRGIFTQAATSPTRGSKGHRIINNDIIGPDDGTSGYGINLVTPSVEPVTILVDNNKIHGWRVGIMVEGYGNTITNNEIYDGMFGIELEATNDNVIMYNDIHDNFQGPYDKPGHGVGGSGGVGNLVNYNDIYDNDFGVEGNSETELDAKYNWWGAIGGPGGEGLGNGDNVTTNVDYDPWLTETHATTVSAGIAYFGTTIPLEPGWNTLSVPLKLKDSADTMSEIVALGDFLTDTNWEIVYRYKTGPGWGSIGGAELVPLRGYYIKILGTDTVDFPVLYSSQLGLSTLQLSNGWNLIGSGFGIDKTDYGIAATTDNEDGQKDVATALYSIKDKCSVVVSPSMQGQVAAWGTTVIDVNKDMIVGEAYWVFMTAPATLAGFEVTPIYYLP